MYSPKISEDLIPILYRIKKEEGMPMTKIVDKILRGYLTLKESKPENCHESILEILADEYYITFR